MESFEGVKRRLELRGTEDGVKVIDDFAHHPTAIEETLKAQKKSRGREESLRCLNLGQIR